MTAAWRPTPVDGIDLVEGVVHLWAGGPDGSVGLLRPDAPYSSPGLGRLVVAAAFARAWAGGRLDAGERTVLTRGRDLGDRGVLPSLGAGLNPTWRDLLVIALTLEDREAVSRLCVRLGALEVADAATALGMAGAAMQGFPAVVPTASARQGAAAILGLAQAVGSEGLGLLLPLLRDGRYRWRVRTRLAEEWEVATVGSRVAHAVEELALWRTQDGWAAAAMAWTQADDAWRAEYAMGDAFRRVVDRIGAPLPLAAEEAER